MSGARAALKVAAALAEVQRSALRRAELGVAAAEAERRSVEAEAKAAQARSDQADLELQRKLQLARSGRRPTARSARRAPLRDTSEAELRAALAQMRDERPTRSRSREADVQMALGKSSGTPRRSSRKSRPFSMRPRSNWDAPSFARRSTASSSAARSTRVRRSRWVWRPRPCFASRAI